MGGNLRAAAALLVTGSTLLIPQAAAAQDRAQVGEWAPVQNWPVGPTHMHLLANGYVMFFGEFEDGERHFLWDPATAEFAELPYAGFNIFCAGHSFLPDGRLLISGGHVDDHVGDAQAIIFDPTTGTWEAGLPKMNAGRWYPTSTTLPSGEILVVSGEMDGSQDLNPLPQVFEPDTGKWRDLVDAQMELPYYPRQFVGPDGRVFIASPRRMSYWLDPSGTGSITKFKNSNYVAPRSYGGAVMYEPGKILIVGGGTPPTNSAEVIDLNTPDPTWQLVAPMKNKRRQVNAVVLPDGKVMVIGGSSGAAFSDASKAVFEPEVWDPKTNTWTEWAKQASFRGYHSTAVLLPDGRVLSGGGRHDSSGQVFSPPYLFRGERPDMGSAPVRILPGREFFIRTSKPQAVAQVTLVRNGSVTHAFDHNSRFASLPFRKVEGGVMIAPLSNNNELPPGHYMLFLVDGDGVPSTAKILNIGKLSSEPKGHGSAVP